MQPYPIEHLIYAPVFSDRQVVCRYRDKFHMTADVDWRCSRLFVSDWMSYCIWNTVEFFLRCCDTGSHCVRLWDVGVLSLWCLAFDCYLESYICVWNREELYRMPSWHCLRTCRILCGFSPVKLGRYPRDLPSCCWITLLPRSASDCVVYTWIVLRVLGHMLPRYPEYPVHRIFVFLGSILEDRSRMFRWHSGILRNMHQDILTWSLFGIVDPLGIRPDSTDSEFCAIVPYRFKSVCECMLVTRESPIRGTWSKKS